MKSYLLSVLIVGISTGNVDILIPEAGQAPIVGWTFNSTPFLMYCQEPTLPVPSGCSSPYISISLHEGSDSEPVLLAVSGYEGWNQCADFNVFDLSLSPQASHTLSTNEVYPPEYCDGYTLPVLPRYVDSEENRRMFLVMNTLFTDNSVQDQTWMTTVSINPWSSSVVNAADTSSWNQCIYSNDNTLSGQIPEGNLPMFSPGTGYSYNEMWYDYYGVCSYYMNNDTLECTDFYEVEINMPDIVPETLTSGYSQTDQLALWTDTAGVVWCSYFTTSVTEPESFPMAIDFDELPFAAAMTRTREDDGFLLAWYDGSSIMVRHWLGEWNGYAHLVEPWTHVSPGNIAVCSDTEGYWVAWKDDTSEIPEYRFIARNTVTGIEEAETLVDSPLRISIGQNPITAVTSYSIELPVQERYTLSLYDISGRNLGVINSGEGQEVDGVLDLSAYSSGVYALVLGTEQGTSTVRILKTGN